MILKQKRLKKIHNFLLGEMNKIHDNYLINLWLGDSGKKSTQYGDFFWAQMFSRSLFLSFFLTYL